MAGPCVGARPRDDEGGARARAARRAPQAEARAALLTLNRRASLSGERGAALPFLADLESRTGPGTGDRARPRATGATGATGMCAVVWSLQVGDNKR